MNFERIIQLLSENTQNSLPLFSPELCIVGTIVALLLVRLFNADRHFPGSIVARMGDAVQRRLVGMLLEVRHEVGVGELADVQRQGIGVRL